MPKAKAENTASKRDLVRVIALRSFGDHPYGHEFEASEGSELEKLIEEGMVRRDDRMARPAPPAAADEG